MRCLIVDDSAHFVAAARGLLEFGGFTVVGVACTAAEALRRFDELHPDVTLVDLDLAGESGFDVAEELHRAASAAPSPHLRVPYRGRPVPGWTTAGSGSGSSTPSTPNRSW